MNPTTLSPAHLPGNSRWRRRWAAALTVSLSVLGVAAVTSAPTAQAVACSTPVKYSTTSNTINLLAADPAPVAVNGAWTLSRIKKVCDAAPLTLSSPGVWELSADLVLNNGTALSLHGSKASSPGDVDTLRLRSLSDNAKANVSAITAHWGTIDADSVTVTSWDDAAGAADTNPNLPAGSATTDRGRAFIRAQSYVDATTGAGLKSTMNINNSTVQNLGYYASESYGVSWKSEGCSHASADLPTCAKAPVTGGAKNTAFSNNFMGTYVWGGNPMTFTDDVFDSNVMYGLDTHDVTKNLDVERNTFSNNGDHGFICSQACDNVKVISNTAFHNGDVPWAGPIPTGDGQAGQVHGIMLHRGITNAIVDRNTVHDQPSGAGIAVFDTAKAVISNNIIDKALYGIRISVGSTANTFTNNKVTGSKYGLFTYKGTDVPTYTTLSGHPTGNVFTGNSFTGSTISAIKLGETDGTKFSSTTFGGGILHADLSAGTVITGGVSKDERVEVTGTSAEPTTFTVADPVDSVVTAIADAFSTVHVTSKIGQLYTVAGKSFSASVSSTKSDVKMTLAKVVTASGVTVAPTKVTVVPNTGKITAKAQPTSTGAKISITPASSTQSIKVTVTGLTPNHAYTITSTPTATTDGAGTLTFTDPGKTATYIVATT